MTQKTQKQRKGKLYRLPPAVLTALEDDANRCRRSETKQLEAILVTYYQLDNVELSDVSASRRRVSPHLKDRWTVPVVEANLNDKAEHKEDRKTDDLSRTKKRTAK